MYEASTYGSVFVITAFWDYIWQKMSTGSIHVCIEEINICPSEWEWIKTGENYFSQHSTVGAMIIAGLCGVYALLSMDLINSKFNLDKDTFLSQALVCLFASWVVGIPMRYFNDPIHNFLFATLREHYYKPLGFWWSSFTDAQSGLIVYVTVLLLKCAVIKII